MMTGLRLTDAVLSDPGRVRKANEDAALARPEAGLWAVADGMGGHANGRRAADTVIANLAQAVIGDADWERDADAVSAAVHTAHAAVRAEAARDGVSMGATVVALLLRDRRFAVIWAGDSRAYLLRDRALHRLTHDHTQVQEMVERGLLSPEEARGHPMSHVLSRAVGVESDLVLDAVTDEVRPGDVFLLCSDGLHGVVPEPVIAARLGAQRPDAACERLLDLCLDAGAPDNVTMIAVACEEATLLSLAGTGV